MPSDQIDPADLTRTQTHGSSDSDVAASRRRSWSAPQKKSPSPFLQSDLDRIDRFEIIRMLGEGGMGRVFLAIDSKLDRKVAIKVPLFDASTDRSVLERFRREGRAAGAVSHPNVVAVHEVGDADQGCYIVSEYVAGPTLREYFAEHGKRFSARTAARLVGAIARGVQAAHAQGVIHRDLKPSNILLDRRPAELSESPVSGSEILIDDELIRPQVADFGLAGFVDHRTAITVSGALVGTPSYMAPEQILGVPLGPQADVFSLGVIVYELVTGKSPFSGESYVATIDRVQHFDPPPLTKTHSGIPRDLSAICECAISKEPQRRYNTAGELADDLQRYLDGQPVRARSLGPIGRFQRWVRRHPAQAALIAVAIISAALVVGLSLRHAQQLSVANADLSGSLSESERLRGAAIAANDQTQLGKELLERHLYVSDMDSAYQAWFGQDLRKYENLLLRHLPSDAGERPGIEWRFLWRLGHPHSQMIDQIDSPLYCIFPSPARDAYAVVGADAIARIYGATNDALIVQFPTGQGEINSAHFSPDGQHIATAGDDGTVKIWRWQERRELLKIKAHDDLAFGALFTPDGKRLISWGREPTMYLWDVETGKRLSKLDGHTRAVQQVRLSPDGKLVASASDDGTIKIWNLENLQQIRSIKSGDRTNCLAFAPDGKTLFAGTIYGDLLGWNIEDGELKFTAKTLDTIQSIDFSPSGTELVCGDSVGVARVFAIRESRLTALEKLHRGRLYSFCFSPEGDRLISCGSDGKIKSCIYPLESQHLDMDTKVPWLATAGENRLVGYSNHGVYLIDATTGRLTKDLVSDGDWGGSRGACANERLIVARRYRKNEVRAWNTQTGELVGRWRVPSQVEATAVSHDASMVAIAERHDRIAILDSGTGETLRELSLQTQNSIARFSPNDEFLAVSKDSRISLFNLQTGRTIQTMDASMSASIGSIDFSPDGGTLATAGADRIIRLWDIASGNQIAAMEGHNAGIRRVRFLSDGQTIISSDKYGFIFWDVQSERQYYFHQVGIVSHDFLHPTSKHQREFNSYAVPHDEHWIALSATGSNTIIDLDVSDVWPPH